jgi:hypothetical protein
MSAAQKITCALDGVEVHHLRTHLAEAHNMTLEEYVQQHPTEEVVSSVLRERVAKKLAGVLRVRAPTPQELTIEIGPLRFPVNHDVPESACLPHPAHYRLPVHGALGDDVRRTLRYWVKGRSVWIWGPPGVGKDALPSAICALTRTPSILFPINADVDILSWFYTKTFDANGTRWENGELFNALVHGYTTSSGRCVPMTIVLSDFDRASRSQAEAIRLVADSIQGRVKGPRGETYEVLPGTRIVITANTMGGGDASGKCVSANVIDTSILDRIERKVKFTSMDWKDEELIIRAKFPRFVAKCEHLLPSIAAATAALRSAVNSQTLYGEFSHRGLCTWIGDCSDILDLTNTPPADLLRQGFMSVADGFPDEETRVQALTLIDPHLSGGALPRDGRRNGRGLNVGGVQR